MKKIHFLACLFFVCYTTTTTAQINQVVDPSFEKINRCVIRVDEIEVLDYWRSLDTSWRFGDTGVIYPLCVPDLMHSCTALSTYTWPNNSRFVQSPHFGEGMVMVQTYYLYESLYYGSFIKRDYLQGRLKKPLVAGKEYCMHFYTNFTEFSAYAINKLGAYVDDGSIDTATYCGEPRTMHTPQVFTTAIITDSINWTKIEGTFIANGTEKFITIGNFSNNANTDTVFNRARTRPGAGNIYLSWYLIDDVSVIATDAVAFAGRDTVFTGAVATDSLWVGNQDGYLPCKWYKNGTLIDSNVSGFKVRPSVTTSYVMELNVCGNVTRDTMLVSVWPAGVTHPHNYLSRNVQVSPNPVVDQLTISNAANTNITIIDMVGKPVMAFPATTDNETINVATLPKGIYLITITDPQSGEKVVRKVVK